MIRNDIKSISYNAISQYPSEQWAFSMLYSGGFFNYLEDHREICCEHCKRTYIKVLDEGPTGDHSCPYCGNYANKWAFNYEEHLERIKQAKKIIGYYD